MLFLHIGLHKTATTSLQADVFSKLPSIEFLGRGPKSIEAQSLIYQNMLRQVCAKSLDLDQFDLFSRDLRQYCLNSNVLVSDEWFTAGYDYFNNMSGCSWVERISRLSELTRDIDTKILCTTRLPSEGLLSQYMQLCSIGMANKYPTYDDYINFSEDTDAWDFCYLLSYLKENFSNVKLVDFKIITSPNERNKFLSDFFGVSIDANMGYLNKKSFNKNEEYMRDFEVVEKFRSILPDNLIIRLSNFFQTPVGKFFRTSLLRKKVKYSSIQLKLGSKAKHKINALDKNYHLAIRAGDIIL